MKRDLINRREMLGGAVFTTVGTLLGVVVAPWFGRARGSEPAAFESAAVPPLGRRPVVNEKGPSVALSLETLQRAARGAAQQGRPLPDDAAQLGGIKHLRGFVVQADGDVHLLGDRDNAILPLHIDDLAVSLRSAYRVAPLYEDVPGVSIDPDPGARDPWRLQKVVLFGWPPCRMAARAVTIDYQLKAISAGLLKIGDMPSVYELRRPGTELCTEVGATSKASESRHRFWFTARVPAAPRFEVGDSGRAVGIIRPVDVQVMSEREFFDRAGRRTGAAVANPEVDQFVRLATERLLATNATPEYRALTSDFRMLELAHLMRHMEIRAVLLRYLLRGHPVEAMSVPAYVGGIRRQERGEATCAAVVTEQGTPTRPSLALRERIASYTYSSRGGVEARVEVHAHEFVQERSGRLARLRDDVAASRPSHDAVAWVIQHTA